MTMGQDDAIAIVGYGGIFPGAGDLDQFWANIVQGVDSTTEVPAGRWLLPPAEALDPAGPRLDRVYTTRGGFVAEPAIDSSDLDLDPALYAGSTRSSTWRSTRAARPGTPPVRRISTAGAWA